MLRIDRLKLHLPTGMEQHASYIAHRIGALLAQAKITDAGYVEHLKLAPVVVGSNTSPDRIAEHAAHQITNAMRRE